MGKATAHFWRAQDWEKARRHFQAVLAKDSAFGDVLHQFSMLEEYDEEYAKALELAHAELRLRPDLDEPAIDIFRIYYHYIAVSDTSDSLPWLRTQPSLYARYFTGEILRKEGNLDAASRILRRTPRSRFSVSATSPVALVGTHRRPT